jgi:hypothetical protein
MSNARVTSISLGIRIAIAIALAVAMALVGTAAVHHAQRSHASVSIAMPRRGPVGCCY